MTKRLLTSHILPEQQRQPEGPKGLLYIEVLDEPGSGGANHDYLISSEENNTVHCRIQFQNGGIAEVGVNGVTQEALLAIVEDRLRCFQEGPYPRPENGEALNLVQGALKALHRRTEERQRRGVEGKQTA